MQASMEAYGENHLLNHREAAHRQVAILYHYLNH